MKKRIFSMVLIFALMTTMIACSGKKDSSSGNADGPSGTLVIGTSNFNGVFSPFFYQTAYDAQAIELVFANVCELDENNELKDKAGHIEAELIENEDGTVQTLYTITIRDGMKFTDGEPVTIDDLIFAYYVYADPAYDGMSTFVSSLDIAGLQEYYYDDPDYTEKVEGFRKAAKDKAADKTSFIEYLIESKLDGWFDGELPGNADGEGMSWVEYLKGEGFDTTGIENDADAVLAMLAECEYQNYRDSYDAEEYWFKKLSEDYILAGLEDGIDVPAISGITKVDELTCTVLVNGVNVIGDRILAQQQLVPEHYYGEGFAKGDLSGVKAKTDAPMGSGPFSWVDYKNNIVTVKANEDYFLGSPKIEYVKYQVIDEEQKVNAIINGDIDITDPAASTEIISELDKNGIAYSLVDYPGYGYIAISAKRVPDLKVREGLMHLMTRSQAIRTYYGELAQVIERPMTPTLGEYPGDAEEYWGYDPAKALECFKEAGYEQIDGRLMKNGRQLVIEVGIGQAASHPSTPILTQMANDLKVLGGELIISDMDFSLLSNRMSNDDIDMWVMVWGNATNCDMTQLYGSEYVKAGGSNRTWIQDARLDEMMYEIMQTVDFDERKALVAEALDRVMSWATIMPVYQRKDMYIYNSKTVNLDTIPKNTSTYYNYVNEIEKLELK